MNDSRVAALCRGDRRALAQAITLVESTRPDHREEAERLLSEVMPGSGGALRIGISGTPGVGKSTFIESFGTFLTQSGHKVAVLAVDPSSLRTGGSILGDKTRMARLGRDPDAFIRPSPTAGELGGVARRTRETIILCEAAGFDVILVETVGVGQSETTVSEMVDGFMLLLAPGGGDELQGIKRGIMELADIVVVNKADGDLLPAARRAAAEYKGALGFMRPRFEAWTPEVVQVSSLEESGIDLVWEALERFRESMQDSAEFDEHRRRQARAWLWSEITVQILDALRSDTHVVDALERIEAAVEDGRELPTVAARKLLETFTHRP